MDLMILSDGHVSKRDGVYYSIDPWLKIAEHMEPHVSSVHLCVPLRESSELGQAIALSNGWENKRIRWSHTYPHESVINYYKLAPLVIRRNLPVIAQAVRESDVIFIRFPTMNGHLAHVIAQRAGKPVVCYFAGDQRTIVFDGGKYQGWLERPARALARLHDAFAKRIVQSSQASVFESETTRERLAGNLPDSYFMFPGTVEEHHIHVRSRSRQDDSSFNLLFVGSLKSVKGLPYLIEALAQLRRAGIDCNLTVCGDGEERENLTVLVKRLELSGHVTWRGYVKWGDELSAVYRGSDILVVPSLSEGVPKVAPEGMANGLPVIACAVGGLPSIISSGVNGILIEPGSSAAIVDAVKEVARNEALRHRLIDGGYAFIRNHTAARQADKLADILYTAASRTRSERSCSLSGMQAES